MANYGDDMNPMKPFFQSFSRIGRKWIRKPFGQNENGRKQFNFTVVSYNILADQLLHEHPWLYSSSQYDSWVYDWNYRKNNLLEEILITRADVLCLQEVQEEHYKNWFYPKLKEQGYTGIYKKRSGTKTDGCATFFKEDVFSLERYRVIDFFKEDIPLMDKNNVAIVTILRPRCSSGYFSPICIGNTHLLFNKNRGDIKLAQVANLFAELDIIARKPGNINGKETFLPIILCGDFNSLPYSPIYNFLTLGELKYKGLLRSEISGQNLNPHGNMLGDQIFPTSLGISNECKWNKKVKDGSVIETIDLVAPVGVLTHDLTLKSCYLHYDIDGSSEISTHHDRASSNVDYIFYTPGTEKDNENNIGSKLGVTGTLKLLNEKEIQRFGKLPNGLVSSDHLLLMASFSLS